MLKVKVYNQQGEKTAEKDLNPAIFDVKVKPAVVQQVVVALRANSRQNIASTKDRSDVRGGGKKPWRQKGTGRARHGSSRSPIWKGGGVTFGPTSDRNFSLKINKKVKRKVIFACLSDKVVNEKLVLLDKLELSKIKTKEFFTILQNLKLRKKSVKAEPKKNDVKKTDKKVVKSKKEKSILIVIPKKDEKIIKSAKNIDRLKVTNAGSLNIVDILKYKYVLMPVESIKVIEKTFLNK